MGRKSKLSLEQWAELLRRVYEGESRRSLADEYGLSEASIRQREAKIGKLPDVRAVANMIVEAQAVNARTEAAYKLLPRSGQINAQTLAQRLTSISSSLASGAELGAKTAHRLHALANNEISKVDDADPLASIESLKSVGVLTKLANDSAQMGMGLLQANREQMRDAERAQTEQRRSVLVVPAVMTDDEWAAETQRLKRE